MKHKTVNILKKTVKISTLTCAALGGAALIASGAALKALAEGGKFLKDKVTEILDEESEAVAAENLETPAAQTAEENPAEKEQSAEGSSEQG